MNRPWRRWTGLIGLGLLVLGAAFGGAAGTARADTQLVSSIPADGSRVTTPPARIVLTFGEALRPDGSTATVSGLDGTRVDSRDPAVDPAHPRQMSVGIGALTPGNYTVQWHAVAAAGNGATAGSLTFVVVDQGTAEATPPPAPVPASGGSRTAARGPLPASGRPRDLAGWLLWGALLGGAGWLLRRRAPVRRSW